MDSQVLGDDAFDFKTKDRASPAKRSVSGVSDAPTPARKTPKRSIGRKPLVLGLLVLALVAAGAFGWHWWTVGRFMVSTDDAYLDADKVQVAPRVAGYISEVLVGDNQPVAAGQVIARIDDREYRIGLAKAEADLARAQAALSQAKTMLVQQQAEIQRAEADVADSEAGLTFARQEAARYQNLVNSGSGTVQRKQQADADLRQMQAGHDRAVASLDLARKKVDTLETQRDSAAADLQSATAQLDQARLDLSYTTIEAPIAGIVGDRSLRLGQYVNAGSNLLTIVPTGSGIYLIANFKETQLGRMKAGQAVDVDIDAIDDHRFKGRIESFAPGTGAQFALLPPENATGNFTKIVQRVPVRITLEKDDPLSARLRPGLSVVATVDTRGTATRAAP